MSQWQECTVVVPIDEVENMYKYCKDNEYNSVQNIFQNNSIAIFTVDWNGNFELDECGDYTYVKTLLIEEYDGERFWTQVAKDMVPGHITDTRLHAYNYIKKWIGENEFEKIKNSLMYCNGKL